MAAEFQNTYQMPHGINIAIADLVRAGMSGDGAAVERLARRLMDEPPRGVRDIDHFVAGLDLAVANAMSTRRTLTRSFRTAGGNELVTEEAPDIASQRFVFNGILDSHLRGLLKEHDSIDELKKSGLVPTSKLLLSGPPGVGKTASAHWLAGHLDAPLIVLNLAQSISSFLGESGRNIQSAFAQARESRAVFLIDEFDALAKRRDDSSDLGELKRLVNVLLLELDSWSGEGLLVAATNHSQLLDPAIQRRFDLIVEVPLPTPAELEPIIRSVLGDDVPSDDLVRVLSRALVPMSNSDSVRFVRSAYRSAIISGRTTEEVLLELLAKMPEMERSQQSEIWRLLTDTGMSSRTIASLADVSHPTVIDRVKKARGHNGAAG